MDFKKYLDITAKELDREVERILSKELKKLKKIDQKLVPLLEAFAISCMGGKRIRGVLVKLGYQLAGKKSEEIIKIGAAWEIFHSAILAHDDIMDQSELRRGKPSLYKALGVSKTVALADFGFFIALKIIAESNFPERYKSNAIKLFAKVISDTAIGQLLDLSKSDSTITAKFKTAQYTIAGPLQLGAILAGVEGKLIRDLGQFGESLGIAFQIKDDILDGEGSSLEEAKKYINSAKKMIPGITKDSRMSKLLQQMGGYLIERKK